MINISQLKVSQADFWQKLDDAMAWDSVSDDQIFNTVNDILKDVKKRGDAAIIEYTNKFDRMEVSDFP